MSHKLGTNISYKSEAWLDSRVKVDNKDQLLYWTDPVPESFEVCCEGIWYYYDPNKTRLDTGHWVPRVATDINDITEEDDAKRGVSAGVIREMAEDVINLKKQTRLLDNVIYPVTIKNPVIGPKYSSTEVQTLTNDTEYTFAKILNLISAQQYDEYYDINMDGVIDNADSTAWTELYNKCAQSYSYSPKGTSSSYWLEVGSWILPKITWSVAKTGSSVVPEISNSVVSGPVRGYINGLSWVGKEGIQSNTRASYTFRITSFVDEDIYATADTTINFGYKLYSGVSDESFGEAAIYNQSMLTGFTSEFVTNGKMSARTFNCTGGKYPYILIPKDFYSANNKTYVNDNLMSDFVVRTNPILVNSRGINIAYVLLRTTYIQTGSAIKIDIR